MSTSSNISLGALRLQARQRSDLEGNPFVTDAEFNQYITQSVKELRDLLVAAYGSDYYLATTYQFNTTNAQLYPLPDGTPSFTDTNGNQARKLYKLLGVDLQYSASPSGWITLKRIEFISRNRASFNNAATNWYAYTNLRYRIEGDNLYLTPIPQTGQAIRLWYVPAPTSLQFLLPVTTTALSSTITLPDTTGITGSMTVFSPQNAIFQNGTTVTGLGSTSLVLSNTALSSQVNTMLYFYSDATTVDTYSGWEEYVIVDAAIKALIKQEGDPSALMAQKMAMKERIETMAEGRDIGQATHVSDVLGANMYGGYGDDYGGLGSGDDY